MRLRRPLSSLLLASLALIANASLYGQDSARYYRIYLRDKGTPQRTLTPSDPSYHLAAEHLTYRCISRRQRVLGVEHVVTTSDLPLYPPYLDSITSAGATVAQMSRWLNCVMVVADSIAIDRIRQGGFVDSVHVVRAHPSFPSPIAKSSLESSVDVVDTNISLQRCITERYGHAAWQNSVTELDEAHRLGFAGNGVLVGVMDAGFDWRNHAALRHCRILAERDFVYGDDSTDDAPYESGAESHGTQVMSVIGAGLDGLLVGGAPHVSFLLAKTEDIRSERHVEEDNFVAALEWLEARGADVANASLSYTTFDSPELPHDYAELDGQTAFATRGVNIAVQLGMICVMAAGNDGARTYRYIGVPAEADSAIAVAAVDSNGMIARFSSRGFSSRSRIKPDVAAMGVANRAADHKSPVGIATGQGTSYAAPLVTASVAVLLSARPTLTPYEVREILASTADRAQAPDTAYGYGVVRTARALSTLAQSDVIVGSPHVEISSSSLAVFVYMRYDGPVPENLRTREDESQLVRLTIHITQGDSIVSTLTVPRSGIVRWSIPLGLIGSRPKASDTVELSFVSLLSGRQVRTAPTIVKRTGDTTGRPAWDPYGSTLCYDPLLPSLSAIDATPNPTIGSTRIHYQLDRRQVVRMGLYNISGQEIRRILDNVEVEPGMHSVDVQTLGLSSGSYFFVLESGGSITVGKVIVYAP